MDEDRVSCLGAFFKKKELYQHAEEVGVRTNIPAQQKIVLNTQSLRVPISTGTQLKDERQKKKRNVAAQKQKQKYTNRHLERS